MSIMQKVNVALGQKKKYDSDSSTESWSQLNHPVKVSSSKGLKYPNPPKPIASSSTFKKKTSDQKMKLARSTSSSSKMYNPCDSFDITPTFDNPATSTQRMMIKSPDMFGDLNLSSTSNSSELNKIPDFTNEHLDDSLLSNSSMELTKIDSLFPIQSIQKISNQHTTIKSSDVMNSEANDDFIRYLEFDDVIKNN